MSDIRNNRRPKNNRRVNGEQRKKTAEAVNSASSVVRTSRTDATNTGEVTLVKNEDYQVLIEDMGNDGEGIGHVQGMTVFVKDAVVGDLAEVKIVKVKKNIAYGRLMKLITPSPYLSLIHISEPTRPY